MRPNNGEPMRIPTDSSVSIPPKGTDLDQLTDQDIDKFVRDLNHRPRKVLGWKSPFEVFFGTKLRLI